MSVLPSGLMAFLDAIALISIAYTCAIVLRARKMATELELMWPMVAVLAGLAALGTLFFADLLVTQLLSRLISHAWAMAYLAEMYLQWSWVAVLFALAATSFGVVVAVRALPRVRLMLHSLSRANAALESEHLRRKKLERQLRQSERAHAFELRKRTMELRQANERLHREVDVHRVTARSLRESEARFRSLSEGSLQGIVVINNEWKVLYVNKAFASMLGYASVEEVRSSLRFESFYAPHEFERVSRYREGRMRGEAIPASYEVDVLRADGSIITIHNTLQQVIWNGESAKQFTIVDVSERKRAELELLQSERRYRNLIENAVQGILIHEDRVPIFANQAYADILGYASPKDVLALQDMERIYAPGEHARLRAYQKARKEGRPAPSQYEFEAVRRDGSIAVLQNVVRLVEWDGRKVTQHNVIDVTDRRRAEEALRASEQHYRELVEGSVQGLLIIHEFTPLFANDAYAYLLGYDSAEEFLQLGSLYERYAPYERERVTTYWKNRIAGKPSPDEYEVDMLHKNGSILTVHNVLRTIDWEGMTAVQVAAIDITARRRAEEEKALLVRDLRERVKELTMIRHLSLTLQKRGLGPGVLCSGTAQSLKRAFLHADVAEVRVKFDGAEAATEGWRRTEWRLEQELATRDGRSGSIEVCYLEARPEADYGPFLTEERNLLKSVAAMLGTYFESEQARREADDSRMLLESAFAGMSEAVFVIEPGTRKIIACNESAGRIFGYPADKITGASTRQLFESDASFESFYDLYAPTLKREGRFRTEYAFRKKNGERVLTEITMTALDQARGVRAGVVCVVRDLTEEKALQDAVMRYRYIVSASRDAMYFVDRSYRYRLVNETAAEWHARSAEEIAGRTVAELHGEDRFANTLKPMLDRCLSGEAVEYQSLLEYLGRGRCEAAIRYDPCRDAGGAIVGVAVSVRDLSAYRESDNRAAASQRVVVPLKSPRR